MTWYPDMGTESMIDAGEHIRAVGWLSSNHPFSTGEVSVDFLARLREFVKHWSDSTQALGWGIFMGLHTCELCGQFHSGGNFGVPCGKLLFAAPEMISHYVEAHQYRPPVDFITAIMQSPLPNTEEYRSEVEPFH